MEQAPLSVLPLDQDESVALLHAWIGRVIADLDARVLLIKGRTAVGQGLRPPRPSADLDVLVDPREPDRLVDALRDLGWVQNDTSANAHVIPEHSRQFRHPQWAAEIDLHHYFPGFFADPEVVFDALWSRRTTREVAHQPVVCPDEVAHAAVIGLHVLRHPARDPHAADFEHLVDVVSRTFDHDDLVALSALSEQTLSVDTLEPLLLRVGAPVPEAGRVPAEQLRDWRTEAAMGSTLAVPWVSELRRTPLRAWPRTLARAAWLSETDLRNRYPAMGPGRRHLQAARARRLAEGLKALPRAIRLVASTKDGAR